MCSADSPGRSTAKTDLVLIFDLDGTILSVNSFPHWAFYMLFGRFAGLTLAEQLRLSLSTAKILMERKLLRRSHVITKSRLQPLWTEALNKDKDQTALKELTALLSRHIRPNMKSALELVAQGKADALLATAAAGEYAHNLGKHMGFIHILATDASQPENSKEQKRDRVLALLAAEGWSGRTRIFFTDHEEDMPLIKECGLTLWFGEDSKLAAVQSQAPQAKIIACRNLPDTGITKLIGL